LVDCQMRRERVSLNKRRVVRSETGQTLECKCRGADEAAWWL